MEYPARLSINVWLAIEQPDNGYDFGCDSAIPIGKPINVNRCIVSVTIKLYKRTLCFYFRRTWSSSATRLVVIMIFLGYLFACLAAVDAQVRPIDPRFDRAARPEWNMNRPLNPSPKTNTVIENKNVNIIVNVDPKDVAKELWKLIQSRLDVRQGRRSADTRHTIDELERIVTPMVIPTRRSHRPSAFEIAYALDHVTRKALISDHLKRPTIDDEIETRDIVARMMLKLKDITENDEKNNEKLKKSSGTRRMQNSDENEHEDDHYKDNDEFINVKLKIRRSELLKGTGLSSDDDF